MDSEEKAIDNLSTSDIEFDIHTASSILNGSCTGIQLSHKLEESNHNLSLYCHFAQLLSVGKHCVTATGSLAVDPLSGNVQAKSIVVATNSDNFENTDGKDTKFEWEFKDLQANESLEVMEVKDTG